MMLLISILIFIPKILLGFFVAQRFWKDTDYLSLALKMIVGFPLGLGISSSMFFVAGLLGISPSIYSQVEFWSVSLIAFALSPKFIGFLKSDQKRIIITRLNIISIGIVLGGVVLFTAAFFVYSRMHPHGFEDAWSMWNLTSRYIYRANSLDILLDSRVYNKPHPDYPAELSLNIAWGWLVLKTETTKIPIALAFLTVFTTAMIIWLSLWKWKNIFTGALAALTFIVNPNFPAVIGQYADPLLTLHMLSAVALLYGYIRTKNNQILLCSGLLAGFSAWTKNEGLLFTAVFTAVCLFVLWSNSITRDPFYILLMGLVPALFIVFIFKVIVNQPNDLFLGNNPLVDKITDWERWRTIGFNFISSIKLDRPPVSVILILGLYALLLGVDRQEVKKQFWIILMTGGQLAGYFNAYLITPHNLQWHIDTSMERLISHVMPLLIFWLFSVIRRSQ